MLVNSPSCGIGYAVLTSFNVFYFIHQIEGNVGLHDSQEISDGIFWNLTDPPLIAAMHYMLMLAKAGRDTDKDYKLELGANDFYLPPGDNYKTGQNETPPTHEGRRRPAEGSPPRNAPAQKILWVDSPD